jgi:hypothetical protein
MFFRPGLTKGLPRGGYYSTHTARVLRVKTRNEGGVECGVVVWAGVVVSWEAGGVRGEGEDRWVWAEALGVTLGLPSGMPSDAILPV